MQAARTHVGSMTGKMNIFGQDGEIPPRPSRPTRMGVVVRREWFRLSC